MNVSIKNITDCLEDVAPLSWQESYDNAGLILGNPDMDCKGVLVCLDVMPEIVDEAIEKGCNMILSHHPFIFSGIKKIVYNSNIDKILRKAMKNNIAIYASHTNMDSSSTGVNYMLAKKIGLTNIQRLQYSTTIEDKAYLGCGAIGELDKELAGEEFLNIVKEKLSLKSIRYFGNLTKKIKKVGLCGGAGAEFVKDAIINNCDCYLTGDIKYHNFLETEEKILLADIGHFESEQFILERFQEIVKEKFPTLPTFLTNYKNKVKFL